MKIDKSRLFRIAYAIYRKAETNTFGEALKSAWKAIKLQAEMTKGVVSFQYKKINGEVRNAVGTLKNITQHLRGGKKNSAEDVMCYFDIEKKAFRSFVIVKLI